MEKKDEQKKKKVIKLILQIIIILFSLALLLITLFTLACTVKHKDNLSFGKYKFYIMRTDAQPEIANLGDLVIVKQYQKEDIKVGEDIVYSGSSDNKFYHTNRIIKTKQQNAIMKLIIAERDGVQYKFSESDVEGRIVNKIPKLGSIIIFLRTPLGTILFLLFVICLFILLRTLFIPRKEDEEDDERNAEKQAIEQKKETK